MGAYSYKPAEADNTTIDGVASQGGSDPKLLDNINRYQAAALANFVRDLGGANTVGGVADAITITVADLTAPTAYFDGMIVSFRAAYSNATSAPTVNVNSLGTKKIKKSANGAEAALVPADILATKTVMLAYRASWDSAAGAFELINPSLGGGVPIGQVADYAGTSAPAGWLFCYGQNVSRTTYAGLFAAIGTTYGAGDGSTTFALPDCRGRVVAGKDDMGGSSANRLTNQSGGLNGDTLGATGGAETHTLTYGQIPAHAHGFTRDAIAITGAQLTGAGAVPSYYGSGSDVVQSTNNQSAPTDQAHNNVQPTIIFNKIIYAGVL